MKNKFLFLSLLFAGTYQASAQSEVTFGDINTLNAYDPADISGACDGIYSLRMDDGENTNVQEATSVWCNSHTLDLTRSFEMVFDIRFGDITEADGMTFTMQNESTAALEGGGGWLGVTRDYGGVTAIQDAVTVEFDIFNNGTAQGDIAADHCAISYNGVLNAPVEGPNAISLVNNQWHQVVVNWDACDTTLTVQLDGANVATLASDLVNNVFGGTATGVFFGFTSGTWSRNTTHDLCFQSYRAFDCCDNIGDPMAFPFSPVPCGTDGCCIGISVTHDTDASASVIYDWGDGTTSYENIHNYATGGTYEITVIAQYHLLDDPMNCCIKTTRTSVRLDCRGGDTFEDKGRVPEDGEGTGAIRTSLYPNPVSSGDVFTLELDEAPTTPVHFSVISMSGQKVMDFQSNGSATIRVGLPTEMSDGLYMIVSNDQSIEPIKFQVKN